ncbi:hypothetical protein GCM10020358_57030 [Amorphoplanes nipponensis]
MAVRYRRGSIALVAVLALTGAGVGAVRAGTPDSRAARWNESATPRPSAVPELPAAGKPRTATARKNPAPARKPSVTRARAVQEARVAVRRNGAAVRSAPGEGYRVVDAVVDAAGTRHVRFQRTHRGLAVLGGDFVVHSTATGRFAGATVAQQHVIDVPGVAKVGRARAVAAAERFAGRRGAGRVRQVVDAFAGEPVRAWEVTVGAQVVIVDATTGAVRRAYDEVHTAEAGTGHGQLVGDVPLGTTRRADGTYALVDPDRGGNTVRDALNNGYLFKPDKFAEFGDADDVWGDGTRADRATAAVDVHYGMARTWDYLRSAFGRSGLHDDGRGVAAYVHHDVDEANASWSSSCECMFFGDGAPTGQPFTSLDVVAHELAHGLNSATADLVNAGESGALNEADSDIFGTLVEFSAHNAADPPDYLIGEKTEIRTPALRRMDEPSRDGKSVSCWSPAAKDLDEHYASGIGNKFFYTLAVGSGASQWGDSPPCGGAPPVAGIGNDRAAQIWYRALTVYMVSNTNYAGARDATGRAAADLYGPDSVERRTVDAAWLAVGVDGSDPAYGAPDLAYFADSSPSPRVGEAVRIQVSAREPQGQPVTFSAVNLPPGVSIDAAGLITGTPTVRGDYRSDIIASDPDGNTDRELMWWTVKGPPVVQSVPPAVTMQLGAGAYGSFTTTFADTPDDRADPADSFEVTATGVPEGLTLTVRRPGSGIYNALVSGGAHDRRVGHHRADGHRRRRRPGDGLGAVAGAAGPATGSAARRVGHRRQRHRAAAVGQAQLHLRRRAGHGLRRAGLPRRRDDAGRLRPVAHADRPGHPPGVHRRVARDQRDRRRRGEDGHAEPDRPPADRDARGVRLRQVGHAHRPGSPRPRRDRRDHGDAGTTSGRAQRPGAGSRRCGPTRRGPGGPRSSRRARPAYADPVRRIVRRVGRRPRRTPSAHRALHGHDQGEHDQAQGRQRRSGSRVRRSPGGAGVKITLQRKVGSRWLTVTSHEDGGERGVLVLPGPSGAGAWTAAGVGGRRYHQRRRDQLEGQADGQVRRPAVTGGRFAADPRRRPYDRPRGPGSAAGPATTSTEPHSGSDAAHRWKDSVMRVLTGRTPRGRQGHPGRADRHALRHPAHRHRRPAARPRGPPHRAGPRPSRTASTAVSWCPTRSCSTWSAPRSSRPGTAAAATSWTACPRNMKQARSLYEIGLSLDMTANVALHLKADDDELTPPAAGPGGAGTPLGRHRGDHPPAARPLPRGDPPHRRLVRRARHPGLGGRGPAGGAGRPADPDRPGSDAPADRPRPRARPPIGGPDRPRRGLRSGPGGRALRHLGPAAVDH